MNSILDNCNFITPYYSSIAQNYFLQRPTDERKIINDKSIIYLFKNDPVIAFRGATVETNGKRDLLAYEMPCISIEVKEKLTKNIVKVFLKEFDCLIEEINGNFLYLDFLINGEISKLSKHLLLKGAIPTPVFSQVIDLSNEEINIKSQIRKSYSSLINWGIRELKPKIFSGKQFSWNTMDQFRKLHIREAGRETRSIETWRKQWEMVQAEEAFVVAGHLNDELVSAGFFMYSKTNCYYLSSASRRDLFGKPLFHSLMWTSILHAKGIGCHWFEVGAQVYPKHPMKNLPSEKELGISDFKLGFGGHTRMFLELKYDSSLS